MLSRTQIDAAIMPDSAPGPRRRGGPAPSSPVLKPVEEKRMGSPRLLRWDELQEWQQEDGFIETGYRPATPSIWTCLQSWFYIHNESVNIFSHFLGTLLFLALPFALYHELHARYTTASTGDTVVFGLYLFGVAGCFALSVAFHTLMSHSRSGYALGIQLDFQGVILLMWGASAPMVYYTFHTEPALQKVYWSLISLFALLASVVTFTPAFRKPATKPLRAGVFGALALSTLTAVVHGLVIHGWDGQGHRFPMWAVGLTLLLNTLGAGVYVLKFPERWWRVKFDIVGASHQLMHCAIILAGLAWLAGMVTAFDNAHSARAERMNAN